MTAYRAEVLLVIALGGCSLDHGQAVPLHSPSECGADAGYSPPTCVSVTVEPAVAGTCASPEGPIKPYGCAADLNQMIIGRWRLCSGHPLFNAGEAGIELVSDFTYYLLADDGGHLVRETGFGNQGTWDSYQETTTAVQFDVHPTPNSGIGAYPIFEDNPRRFSIALEDGGSTYVYDGP